MATVAVLLIIGGCNMEPIPSAEVVAVGDIASCRTGGRRGYRRAGGGYRRDGSGPGR
jgi:hypothetical protein